MSIELVIADPRSSARAALKQIVERWGWVVTGEAGDSLEAVRLARELGPDVLIVDAAAGDQDIDDILRRGPSNSGPLVVRLIDHPQEHAARGGITVLKGMSGHALRDTIMSALESAKRTPSGVTEWAMEA
jgi:AmiR/NasT family two-component response regulator